MLRKGQKVLALHLRQRITDMLLKGADHLLNLQAGVAAKGRGVQKGIGLILPPGNARLQVILPHVAQILRNIAYLIHRRLLDKIRHHCTSSAC